MKKVMVIINPTSGSEKAVSFIPKIEEKFGRFFDNVDIRQTGGPKDATNLAIEAGENGYEAVIAAGGDGTVNEVIAGMARCSKRPRFGIIPLGTVNLLARVMGMSMNVSEAIDSFSFDRTKKIDIGKSNDNYFANIFSIGAVSEGIHNVGIEEKTKFGAFAYALSTMKGMVNDSPFHIKIESDNGRYEGEASHVIVLLSDYFGSMKILNDENKCEGFANVLVLKNANFYSKISLIPDMLKGEVEGNDNVAFFKASRIHISSEESDVETDLDGDKSDNLPVSIEILPAAIEIYCN